MSTNVSQIEQYADDFSHVSQGDLGDTSIVIKYEWRTISGGDGDNIAQISEMAGHLKSAKNMFNGDVNFFGRAFEIYYGNKRTRLTNENTQFGRGEEILDYLNMQLGKKMMLHKSTVTIPPQKILFVGNALFLQNVNKPEINRWNKEKFDNFVLKNKSFSAPLQGDFWSDKPSNSGTVSKQQDQQQLQDLFKWITDPRVWFGVLVVVGILLPLVNKYVFEEESAFMHEPPSWLMVGGATLYFIVDLYFGYNQSKVRANEAADPAINQKNSQYTWSMTNAVAGMAFSSLLICAGAAWALGAADYAEMGDKATTRAFTTLYGAVALSSAIVGLKLGQEYNCRKESLKIGYKVV